jgi:hypothetical protein
VTTRVRAIIITIALIFIFALLQFLEIGQLIPLDENITKALIVSVFFYISMYWVLNFNIRGIRFITILGYSAIIIFIQALFLQLVVFQDIGRISEKTFSVFVLLVFGLSVHFLILTTNILNVSYISKIPLAQAAKAANFIYTLFGAYFAYLLIFKAGVEELIQFLLFAGVTIFLTANIFWFKKESTRQLIGESAAVVLSMVTLYVIFIIWPLSVEVATMFYIIVYYVLIGLGLEERETTSALMRVEYITLFVIVVLLLLKVAVWGINGSVI